MGRSGYDDYGDGPDGQEEQARYICWRGAVASSIRGKRGQRLLVEMLAALDAMPVKTLAKEVLVDQADGSVCALGCLGKARGIRVEDLDPTDYRQLAGVFGVADKLIREIEWVNDDFGDGESRFRHVREWVVANIKDPSVT